MSEIIGVGQISLLDLNDALISGMPPKNPSVGTLWIDESLDPPMLKKWNGESWIDLGELDPDLSVTLEFISETLGNMANDNLIDFKERQIIKDKITEIIGYVIADTATTLPTVATLDNGGKGGFWSVRKSARNVGIATNNTAYTNLATRYNELKSYLEGLTPISAWDTRNANKDVVISVTKSTFRDRWLQYYLAIDALAEATLQQIKKNEEALQEEVDNVGQKVDDVIGRVVDVESKVTDEAIVNKVTSSEKYLLDLQAVESKVAKLLTLEATSNVMTFDANNAFNPSSQTITFKANTQNLSGTPTFTAIPYNSTGTAMTAITLGGSGKTRTLTHTQFGTTAVRVVVTASLDGLSDTVTIVKVKDGAKGATGSTGSAGKDAIVGFLTNESITLSADVNGNVSSFATATGTFEVYEGITKRTGSPTYSVASSTGCTVSITTAGVYSVTAMTADTAKATLRAVYNGVTINKDLSLSKSRRGVTGSKGDKGSDGISVVSIVEEYYHSTSATSLSGGSWSTTVPTWQNGRYVWTRAKTTFSNGSTATTNPVNVTGSKGADGVQRYTWVKYADDNKGSGMSDNPNGKKYIGLAFNKTTSTESNNANDYDWSEMPQNIEIGGRNLVLNSEGDFVVAPKNTGESSDNFNYRRFYADMELGGTYTISAEIEVTHGNFSRVSVYPYPKGSNTSVNIVNGRIYHTFKKNSEETNSVLIYAGISGETRGQGIKIRKVKIEKGDKATDWTPAPEDIQQKIDDLSGLIKVRYIRDWLNGNSVNTANHWVEIQAMTDKGSNVALNKPVTASSGGTNLSRITDGSTDTKEFATATSGAHNWVQVDLGSVYDNIDYVNVWHYYSDERIYNGTKTEVSEDGVNWITIFDSKEEGTYTETSEGKEHVVNAGVADSLRDVGREIVVIASQINNVEEMMTAEGITTVITESVFYENLMSELDSKADLDQLGDLASKGELDELSDDVNDKISDAIQGIDFEPYATKLELEETSKSILAKFSATGGMNLVKNSIGFADLDFWKHVYSNTDTATISNLELDTLGFGSGFYFPTGANKGIYQDIPVVAGQIYTMSWYLNKVTSGTSSSYRFYIQIQEHDGASWVTKYSHPDNTTKITNGYEYEHITYTPTTDTIRIRFISYADCEANLTGVMLNIGDVPLQWSLATGEMYNTNIRMDINGIRVSQLNEDRVEIGYTHITPDEFAGYYDTDGNGTFEKVFYLNGEETVTKKLVAQEEITMGTIKVIKIDAPSRAGWAFVPTVDMFDNIGEEDDDDAGSTDDT